VQGLQIGGALIAFGAGHFPRNKKVPQARRIGQNKFVIRRLEASRRIAAKPRHSCTLILT
jgi:hypothetical protein